MRKTFTVAGILILTSAMMASGQGLSSVMDAIDKLDQKLTRMIGQETSSRKSEDAKLRKAISKRGGTTKAVTDPELKKDVEELIKAVEQLNSAKIGLKEQVSKLENNIQILSEKGDDARVKEMASDLKALLYDLKISIEKKEEQTKKPEKEEGSQQAMDVGGSVSLAWGGEFEHLDTPDYGLGGVELAANVYITEDITASVALKSGGDPEEVAIDQAIAVYEKEKVPFSFIFGLQTLNHGLLSTHLISDPTLIDNVELAVPGLTINYALQQVTVGAGFTIIQEPVAEGEEELHSNHACVLNADFEWMKDSPLRLSTLLSQDITNLDLATTVAVAGLSIDVEGFTQVSDPERNPAGYFIGLAYGINDHFEIAARHDGYSEDGFKDLDFRIAGGITINLPHDFYCAVEVSHDMPNSGGTTQRIDVELGTEATIPLPGFQRRTLKRN